MRTSSRAPRASCGIPTVERQFVSAKFRLRALVEDVVGCGVDLPEGEAMLTESAVPPETLAPMTRELLAPHLEGAANAFRRRHRMHGTFALYGGRIDPGKGCEELLEYYQAYVKEGGDATLMLMGVKLMPLPDDPRVRFAGISAGRGASPRARSRERRDRALAVREPVAARPRGVCGRHACPGQRPRRSAGGTLPTQQRRALLRGSVRVIEALKLLLRDPSLRAAMGRNGKQYVNRNYRWETILSKYERLFTRVRQPVRDIRPRR